MYESEEARIRVLLADDHPVVRDGIRRLLQMQPDLKVVGLASDGAQAVELTLRLHPDVVVMDVGMPGVTGIEATRRIKLLDPRVHIVGLSMYEKSDLGM